MEFNQTNFARILEGLKDTARLQGNMLTGSQISEAFGQWQLDDARLALIHDYFRGSHIGIDEPGDVEDSLSISWKCIWKNWRSFRRSRTAKNGL